MINLKFWKRKKRIKKTKSLFEEIAQFLNYIQENENNPKKRTIEALNKKFGKEKRERIQPMCDESNYLKDYEEIYSKEGKGEKTIKIGIRGLKFLEEYGKEKGHENREKGNLVLTYALFAAAFLQGIILIIYNYLDLNIRAPGKNIIWILRIPNIFIIVSILMLLGIFCIIKKLIRN
jgi:hypothetical protein